MAVQLDTSDTLETKGTAESPTEWLMDKAEIPKEINILSKLG